jgi:hypothetical protein
LRSQLVMGYRVNALLRYRPGSCGGIGRLTRPPATARDGRRLVIPPSGNYCGKSGFRGNSGQPQLALSFRGSRMFRANGTSGTGEARGTAPHPTPPHRAGHARWTGPSSPVCRRIDPIRLSTARAERLPRTPGLNRDRPRAAPGDGFIIYLVNAKQVICWS